MRIFESFVVLACITLSVACNRNENGYTIKGVVPAGVEDGEIVYMTDHHEGIVVNSAVVSRNQFVFKGDIDSAKAIMLSIQDLHADLILDKGTLTVDMSDPYNAKGNPLTEKMNEFYAKCEDAILRAKNRIFEMDDSLSDEEKDQMQETIFDELLSQLDEIPAHYLREHPNDILGAMIFYIWMQNQMELSADFFHEASRLVGENVLKFGPIKQMSSYFDIISETAID